MKPHALTQIELATLAASLPSGAAKERVTLALEIWMESAKAPAIVIDIYRSRLDALDAELIKSTAMFMTFDKALETILPDSHPAVRVDEWERFRGWQRNTGIDVPALDREREIGVHFHLGIYDDIKEWRAAEKKFRATEKALNAAKERWAKAGEEKRRGRKAGGKTQQVKKKSKT